MMSPINFLQCNEFSSFRRYVTRKISMHGWFYHVITVTIFLGEGVRNGQFSKFNLKFSKSSPELKFPFWGQGVGNSQFLKVNFKFSKSYPISQKNPDIPESFLFFIPGEYMSVYCVSQRWICFWFVVALCAVLDLRSEGKINQLLKVLRFVYLTQAVAWRRCGVSIQTNYACLLGESDVM